MLQYLPHARIDFTLWDDCVKQSVESLIYAYSGYLEISTAGKWDAVVEIKAGKYVSVFPLPYKKRFGISFIYQPFHSQQLGLFTTPESFEKSVISYLALIPGAFRKIYLQLNTTNTLTYSGSSGGFTAGPRQTFHLELHKSYEILKKGYSESLKRNLRKAQKQPYGLISTEKLPDLIGLFRETRGRELKDVKTRHYQLFEKQYKYLQKNGLVQIKEVRSQQELIAGAVFLLQPGKVIFLFSSTSERGRKHGAMTLLIDSVIKEYAGTQTILDFEGSSIPNLIQFYSSFGAKSVTYLSVSKNNLPWYLRWLLT